MRGLPIFAAALLAAACGKPPVEEKKAVEAAKPVEYFHVDAATAGTVAGVIAFRGAKPARQAISMEADEGCQKAQAGKPVCLCTSCEPRLRAVEGVGKRSPETGKPPGQPQFGPQECETGFRRGFSQLTFAAEGGEYEPSGFPTQP